MSIYMCGLRLLVSIFGLTFVSVASTRAQTPTEGVPIRGALLGTAMPGFQPLELLVVHPAVQKEIELTPDQLQRWTNAKKAVANEIEALRKEFDRRKIELRDRQDLEGIAALVQGRRDQNQELLDKRERQLSKILDRRQLTRLREIQLQTEGFKAFNRPEIQERLNLSPVQIESITHILVQSQDTIKNASIAPRDVATRFDGPDRKKSRAYLQTKEGKPELEKVQQAVRKANQSTMQAIGKELTKGQRAKYTKMLGEPFDWTGAKRDSKPAETEPARETK